MGLVIGTACGSGTSNNNKDSADSGILGSDGSPSQDDVTSSFHIVPPIA